MIVSEICSIKNYKKKFAVNYYLYNKIIKKYGKITFINCHYLVDKENIIIDSKFKKDKRFIFFHPRNYSELNNFLKKNKIYIINNLSFKLYHLRIYFLLNKKNIYQIEIDNLGIFSDYKLENWDTVKLKKKVYFLYLKKFSYLIYKILFFLRILKFKDKLFISRKDIYKKYLVNFKNNLLLKPKYRKVVPTRLKSDSYIGKKLSEKYIVYLDQNINHKDSSSRGMKINLNQEMKFFKSLSNYLSYLKKLFNKKVIICLHPSSDDKKYKKNIKEFKIIKYQTEKYINDAYLVLFHSSSSVIGALLKKKRIINLKSLSMGKLNDTRRFLYLNKFNLLQDDIEKKKFNMNKNKLFKSLNKNTNNYFKELNKKFFTGDKYKSVEKLIIQDIGEFFNIKT